MATSNKVQYSLEFTRYSLRAVRISGGVVDFCRECPLDKKPAVDDLLVSLAGGVPVLGATAITLPSAHWHVASTDEAKHHRGEEALRQFAAGLSHALPHPLAFVSCRAEDGAPVSAKESARWLAGITSASTLAAEEALLKERGVAPLRTESATLGMIGAVVASLRLSGGGNVLLWDVGLERSSMFMISARGVETAASCAIGFDTVFGVIQNVLELKLRRAASRLFFNDDYDFDDVAQRIGMELAPALKTAMQPLLAPGISPQLACIGFTGRQGWLVREAARAAGLAPWKPDTARMLSQSELQLAPGIEAAADFLGVLHLAASQARQSANWRANWSPAVARPAEAAAPAVTAAVAERPVAAMALSAARPAVAVSQRPAESPAKAKTAAAPAAPRAADLPRQPAAPRAAAAPAASPVRSVDSGPARRRGAGLYLAIAALVAAALIGGKLFFDARAARELVEQQQVKLAQQQQLEAERAAKSKAELGRLLAEKVESERRIRLEADKARDEAVALARKQAEDETRQKVTAQFEADRIAHSPGILVVTTSPDGASVQIDDGPVLKAPLSLNTIMPGTHRVAVTLRGYDTWVATAAIKGAQTTDLGLIKLQRAFGTIIVGSIPDGVGFTVHKAGPYKPEEVRHGSTPALIDDLDVGTYVVTYDNPGWSEHAETVAVAKGGSAHVSTKYTGGAVTVTTTPAGAAVTRDGVVIGTTPLSIGDLSPQPVSYAVTLPSFEPATLSGVVTEGRQLKLDATLLSLDHISAGGEIRTPPLASEKMEPRLDGILNLKAQIVRMSFVVWRDGTPREIVAADSDDKELAQRCVEAVKHWKFQPAIGNDGQPINVRVVQPIRIMQPSLVDIR